MAQQFEYFGKYILLEKLATGGMAEVFLARRPGAEGIAKFLAIKRILPQFADSPEFIDMFRDEAKIAINLSHSNIVSIHEFGIEKEQFYLVMDYVEGRNLRQLLNKMKRSNSKFSVDQIVYMIKEVAAGIDHAHRCLDGSTGKPLNITHRDISPQNIMASFEGELKIVDFGIAKAESQMDTTRAGTLKGKFGYMSPEQAEGQAVDLRTDIFSLGIVLWELLANDRLFMANNEINTLRKIRDCQVPSLKKINPNIATELDRITLKALTRDRNLRYQTAAAMHRDLNRYLNRQYPDFSHHDFSVFIKTLFADEILSTRKRLIEYAKIPFPNQEELAEKAADKGSEKTVAGKGGPDITLTSSFVSTSSPDRFQGTKNQIQSPTKTTAEHQATRTAALPQDNSTFQFSEFGAKEDGENNLNIKTFSVLQTAAANPASVPVYSRKTPGSDSLHERSASEHQGAEDNLTPPLVNSLHSHSSSPEGGRVHLDEDSLDQAMKKQIRIQVAVPPNLETEEISGLHSHHSHTSHRYNTASRSLAIGPRRSFGFTNVLLILLALVTAYALSVTFWTESMRPAIAFLDPYFAPLHRYLGVTQQQDYSSMPAPPRPEKGAATVAAPDAAPAAPTAEAQNVDGFGYPAGQAEMIISSSPSGAEIYVNGRNTQLFTPARVMVPANKPFLLDLKRSGYVDYTRENVSREAFGTKLLATLQKASVGYLNVDVRPPKDARIYINGVLLKGERLPLAKYAVPAGRQVTVRAENPYLNVSEEKTIVVQAESQSNLIFNLRKGAQNPVGSQGASNPGVRGTPAIGGGNRKSPGTVQKKNP